MSAATTVATATAMESTTHTAAVEATTSATTVEPTTHAATVEPTGAAMEAASSTTTEAAAANRVAVVAAHGSAAESVIRMGDCSTAITYAASIAITMSIPVSVTVAIAMSVAVMAVVSGMPVAAAPVAATPVAVIPRAGADEEPADKPAGTVEAVRRAGVGIVAVVAIRADRCWTVGVSRTGGVSRRVIRTAVLVVVAGITGLGLGALCHRQWRSQQSQRKHPSKESLHINIPHSTALLLTVSGSCGRGSQLFYLIHPAYRTPLPT